MIFTNHEHRYFAASFWLVMKVGLNFSAISGSLMMRLVISSAAVSIFSPSKVYTLLRNLSGLFITYPAFFHTLSRSSLTLTFSPMRAITALAVTFTIIGG